MFAYSHANASLVSGNVILHGILLDVSLGSAGTSWNTYFCLFAEVFCLKPALSAVFMSVFLANPLEIEFDKLNNY